MKLSHCLSAIALACLPALGSAAPITYTFTGTAEVQSEGSTGSQLVDFSLVINAFTTGVYEFDSNVYINDAVSNVFTYGSNAATSLTNVGLYVGIEQLNAPVGVTFGFADDGDWLKMGISGAPDSAGLDTYELDSNFGPYTVTSPAFTGGVPLYLASGGSLNFLNLTSATFTATLDNAVPEPGSFALAGLALAGLALTRRRKA